MKFLIWGLILAGICMLALWRYHDVRIWHETRTRHLKASDKRISFTELAFMRRDLTTARNMIKLGLVKTGPGPSEEVLSKIYKGFTPPDSGFSRGIVHKFGLTPASPNFVGEFPGDPKRKISS